jgi:AraC-like DNA-binding protein
VIFFQKYNPPHTQRNIIREYQILHMKWDDTEPLPPPFITCLANTEQNLYFYPRDNIKVMQNIGSEGTAGYSAYITGPKFKPVGLKFGKDYLMIKVAFQPTGLYRLLKISMQRTVNTGLDAADFFPEEIGQINKELKGAIAYDDMIRIVSGFINDRITKGIFPEEPIDRVAIKMLDPEAKYNLTEWASIACLSLRQFERNFTSRVGISPKLYLRIVRFENAMKVKNSLPGKSWSEIALECEYDDSSHMLREFRQFADFPPGTLLKKQTSGYSDFPTG